MILQKETEVFFSLLMAGLWTDIESADMRNQGFAESVDWGEVYQLAEEQSVIGIVLAGIEHSNVKPPQELLLQWIGEVQMLEQQNKAMNGFVAELIEKLRTAEIYSLLLKGQGIAREKHLGMTIDGFVVELHGTLRSGLSSRVEKGLDEIKKAAFCEGKVRSWSNGGTQVFLLNADEDVVYVFTHMLQHFFKEGLGLRQVCDWCRLLYRYRSELDLRLLESRIRRMGLLSEWKAFGAFAVEYLGMPVESMSFYSDEQKWKKKADKICAFILEVGNMGHNRDMSYFEKYPYLIRKVCSMGRRSGDLMRHARIFPLDSLSFFPRIMFNGLRSAIRGE